MSMCSACGGRKGGSVLLNLYAQEAMTCKKKTIE